MWQTFSALIEERCFDVGMPGPCQEVIPGVRWGRFDVLFTPAFWFTRAWHAQHSGAYRNHRLGSDLREEVAVCLLGGHGMPAELGLAAFERLRQRGLLVAPAPGEAVLLEALSQPLPVKNRTMRYRYPLQRSRMLARALARLDRESPTGRSDLDLREWLFGFEGIGMKTASWITRNHFGSDNVAILDVHVFRAGVLAQLFDVSDSVARHYRRLEARFLEFAKGLGVRASILDALLWAEMRQMAPLAIECLDTILAVPPNQCRVNRFDLGDSPG